MGKKHFNKMKMMDSLAQQASPFIKSFQGNSNSHSNSNSNHHPTYSNNPATAPLNTPSAPHTPNSFAPPPYNPSFINNATGNHPGQVFQSSQAPPPLSDLGRWFNYYDRDRSGTLDKEEVVFALVQTSGATSVTEQQNIRETVYNVFPAFDDDGSGEIDKREFCARNGLGESLQALMKQNQDQYSSNTFASSHSQNRSTWKCNICTFQNFNGKVSCAMCGSPMPGSASATFSSSPYNPNQVPQQQQQQQRYQLMRAPIPSGMQPGQQMQVRVGPSGTLMLVVIPDQRSWIVASNNGQPTFEFRIPVDPTPVVAGTVVAPSQGGSAAGCMSSQPGPRLSQVGPNPQGAPLQYRQEWSSFNHFQESRYQPPPLRVDTVSIPPTISLIRASGRRRALLVGINYTGTRAALRGCINDAKNIKRLLVQQGYPDDTCHMVMLTDEHKQNSNYLPTAKNISKAMQWLLQGVSEGDVLFFHFSGHGAQVPDQTGQEADGLNETILPLDYKKKQITDDELWGSLVYPLPSGSRLTAIMDCCHSGTGLDLPFEYKLNKKGRNSLSGYNPGGYSDGRWIEEINPAHSKADVVLFSGCEDSQTSADTADRFQAGGAMTQSFIKAFEKNPMSTYPEFLSNIHKNLKRRGFSQRPQLTSSQAFNVNSRIFSFIEGIESNRNQKIGRIKRKHIKPGKNSAMGSGMDLDDFLFGGGGTFGKVAALAAGATLLGLMFD